MGALKIITGGQMRNGLTTLNKNLESIRKVQDDLEYWSARELMPLLGYSKWQTFSEVIKKAIQACSASSQKISDHFTGVSKMVALGSEAQREIEDFIITRCTVFISTEPMELDFQF